MALRLGPFQSKPLFARFRIVLAVCGFTKTPHQNAEDMSEITDDNETELSRPLALHENRVSFLEAGGR